MSTATGPGKLGEFVAYASLDEELFALVAQPTHREVLRLAITDHYFPEHRDELLALSENERGVGQLRDLWRRAPTKEGVPNGMGASDTARSTAFARTVKDAYDYRCAACGIRFLYDDVTLIDAAHLIPFSETGDDSPQNGMALCKNHHWLMDRRLMSPGPGPRRNYARPIWHVCKYLDERIEGHKGILKLKGTKVIMPGKERWYPKREALERRMEMLRETS